MLEDDILHEVRAAREAYAKSHGYDVRAMVADLRSRDLAGDWTVVRHPPRRAQPVSLVATTLNPTLPPTGPAPVGSENVPSQQAVPAVER